MGREDFEHLNKKNSCPDYDKNYDLILKKTVLMVPHLKLTSSRISKALLKYIRIKYQLVQVRIFLIMDNLLQENKLQVQFY